MRSLRIFFYIAMIIVGATTQSTALAADGHSLSKVAAIIADAVATDDTEMLEKHAMNYEDMLAISATKTLTKSAYSETRKKNKKRVDETWREIREANILPERIQIEEVEIQQRKGFKPDQHMIVATVFPVFAKKGKDVPVPYMALHFVQIKGQWKYWF